ncbi:uncharacterized protein LOC141715014 [Apium graveolens]|uniref:uncharacterized protein LOC141715014 n=1 Tax=Apium graveolens TaxID=4045 RepID=UPI003D7BB6D3
MQYFQGREIRVVTDQQLRKIIHEPDASGRLFNWAIELSQFNIKFVPRRAIKARALAEFVMECTFPEQQPPVSHELTQEEANPGTDCWKLYMDGSSTTERSGAGLILISPEGFTIQQAITFSFKATKNQAEYEALMSGLRLAKSLGISKMVVYSDSQIVINREENSKADELSKLVQNTSDLASSVYFEELEAPSTAQSEVLCIGSTNNWMTPYIVYLRDGTLPEDQNKARYLKHKAARFFLENGQLYRRTFSAPTLKCVDLDEANYCLQEVHEGICGDHLAAKALAYKVIRQGYYWPIVHADSISYVNKCPQCQKFSNVPRQSPSLSASVLSPTPFVIWGIDIMGPFPQEKGDLRYILVAIDYMTKWAEAKAMRTINQQDCIKFMDTIIMRFGISVILVSNNGPQFVGSDFEAYLKELGIKHKRASVAHPQGNGQVEVTNRTILRDLKKD